MFSINTQKVKTSYFIHVVFISLALLFAGCDNDQVPSDPDTGKLLPGSERMLFLTAGMPETPDQLKTSSRIALKEEEDNSITLTWQPNDAIELLFVQGDKRVKSKASVYRINARGISAEFRISIPGEITDDDFDLYGVYGGEGFDELNPELVKLPANPPSSSTLQSIQEEKGIMLTFANRDMNAENSTDFVAFEHLGTLLKIYLVNSSVLPINNLAEARLVSETGGWAYNNNGGGKYNLLTSEFEAAGTAGTYLSFASPSSSGTIAPGDSVIFWGWFPPLPEVNLPELKLELRNSSATVLYKTVDSKEPRRYLDRGKTYSFSAEWNGLGFSFEPRIGNEFTTHEALNLSGQHLTEAPRNYFVNLENGVIFNTDDFEYLDPVTMDTTYNGAVCSGPNVSTVSEWEYNTVDPYFFLREQGSMFLHGPAHNNLSLMQYRTYGGSVGKRLIDEAPAYGTPIILFRTLNTMDPFEKYAHNIVKSGDSKQIANLFDGSFINLIDLSTMGNATSDGFSNVPSGRLIAVENSGPANNRARPWAQKIVEEHNGNNKTTISLDPGSVVLVLYYNVAGIGDFTSNLKKIGFMDIYNYNQVEDPLSTSNMDFTVYWEK